MSLLLCHSCGPLNNDRVSAQMRRGSFNRSAFFKAAATAINLYLQCLTMQQQQCIFRSEIYRYTFQAVFLQCGPQNARLPVSKELSWALKQQSRVTFYCSWLLSPLVLQWRLQKLFIGVDRTRPSKIKSLNSRISECDYVYRLVENYGKESENPQHKYLFS